MLDTLMQRLRSSVWINTPIRNGLRLVGDRIPEAIRTAVIPRWRVSGVFDVEVNGVRVRFSAQCDDGAADTLFYRPKHYGDVPELKLVCALASRSSVVLDIGACTGLYSILAALSSASVTVISCEPFKSNARRLRQNVALNRLSDRIDVVETAVGEMDGVVSFTAPENDQICDVGSRDHGHTQTFYRRWIDYKQIQVPQKTIDAIVAEKRLTTVDVIKIDVERLELQVLTGAAKTLTRWKPPIVCEVFIDASRAAFFDHVLRPLGYHPYLILPGGVVRCQRLQANPDSKEYLFSTGRTRDRYTSFADMPHLISELTSPAG